MKDGQGQFKQHGQKYDIDEDLMQALEQQLETQKLQMQNQSQEPQISEHLANYQLYVTNLSNVSQMKHKNQIVNQKPQTKIFTDLWEECKFNPSKFITSLSQNSIKYEPYSKPFFSQSFFVSKTSQNGSFLTVNLSIGVFVMKLCILMEPDFIISESIFEDWQTKQLKYVDSGSFSDIFEYYDSKTKENIVIKKIKFSKTMQITIQAVVYEYAFLKLASALEIGLEIRPIFGFDLIFRKQDVLFGMQKGYKSYQTSIDSDKLYKNILSSLILLHSLNITHCDIRPQNIEYSNRLEKYVLIDYGLSECLDESLGYKSLVSNFKGTYHYSSVEMQKLFFSQNKYVDMYFNDIHCLKKTIEEEAERSETENLEVKFSIIHENEGIMNKQKSFFSKKQGQRSTIINSLSFLNKQYTQSVICIPSVLRTVFSIYKMDRQLLQMNLMTLNHEQILLAIKAFYDLEIDDQYRNFYNNCLETIKKQNLQFIKIESELDKIKRKTLDEKSQQRKGILLLVEKFERSHFYFDCRSYLIQLWNFYQLNILQDFLNYCRKQKSTFNSVSSEEIEKQDYNFQEKILKRKYRYRQFKQIKISRIFFMFFKEMERIQSNKRLQAILLLQFCLHYCQKLILMYKKIQLDSFMEKQVNSQQISLAFCEVDNEFRKITVFFNEVKDMSQKLIMVSDEINNYFFDRKCVKKKNQKDIYGDDDLTSQTSHTRSQTQTFTHITTQQLIKMLRPQSVMMSERQKEISTQVHKIFVELFNKYIKLTSWQTKFNLQYYLSYSYQFRSNENKYQKKQEDLISNLNRIQFHIYNLNRSKKDLIVLMLILFVLTKMFYQGSAFSFQQKFKHSISVAKNCTQIVTLLFQSHYNMIIKFEENQPSTKIENHQDYIDIGGFKKFEQKIIQCIQYLFESYSMILDFIIEQDLQNIDSVIQQNVDQEFDKIKTYQQFKDFYQIVCNNIRFYNIFKKQNQNQPVINFVDKNNFIFSNIHSTQTFSLLDSYFQEFHSNKLSQKQIQEDKKLSQTTKFSICLSTFYKHRFLLVCQQITLFLESLGLKIKTNLKFPVKQKQFYDLFMKIQKLQNYDRKQEQKLCVILRYADHLFIKQNISSGIFVLEKLNQCINRKQLIQIHDNFFHLLSQTQKNTSNQSKCFQVGMPKKKGSFNYLVIQENLIRVYTFMKSDKLKTMKGTFFNQKEARNFEKSQTRITKIIETEEKQKETIAFSLKSVIEQVKSLQIRFSKQFKQRVSQIGEMNITKNEAMSSSWIVEAFKQDINNSICRIKCVLSKLDVIVQHNKQKSSKSWKRQFLEQFFEFLSFLDFNCELVMEKLWSILCRIRKKFNDDTQKAQEREMQKVNRLKVLVKFMLDLYLKQCAIFSMNVDLRCEVISGKDIQPQNQFNHIKRNDQLRWLRFKELVGKKSQLIKKVFILVIEQNQLDWFQNLTIADYDQDDEDSDQMIGCHIDFLYFRIKYTPQCHIITDESNSTQLLLDTTLYKIVYHLLAHKIHTILSSKKEYLIFMHYVNLKLKTIHNLKKSLNIPDPTIPQSNDKASTIFQLISMVNKLTRFLTSIQSSPFTESFIKLIKDIASTSGFTIFLLQLIPLLFNKSCSISPSQAFINHGLSIYQLKNDMYFLTFCFEGLLNSQKFLQLISDCFIYKNKMAHEQIKNIKNIFHFFKLFAHILQFKTDSSHKSLKKYLTQKRQFYKYFLIVSLHGKLFHSISYSNQSQFKNQLIPFKRSKDYKRIIINSFRKVNKFKLYFQIEQKINLNMQIINDYLNQKIIKYLTSKLQKKHKKWIQINDQCQSML